MRLHPKACLTVLCTWILSAAVLAAEPAPRAELSAADYEFAPVVEGLKVRHDFTVRNTGDAPLVFGAIRSG